MGASPQNGPVLQKPLKVTSSTCLPCSSTYAGPCGTFYSSSLVALNPPYCHLDLSSLPSGLYVPRVQAFPVPEGTASAVHQSLVLRTASA